MLTKVGGRLLLRWAAGLVAVALVVLWVFLVAFLYRESNAQPAPAVVVFPLFFLTLAVWAAVAAIRDEPVLMVLAGGLSLVPVGLFLLFMPGFARWIGILDLALLSIGLTLLKWFDPG